MFFGPPLNYHTSVPLLFRDNITSKATGNSRSGIPENRGPQNSRLEFPGICEILAGIMGNFASFVFFQFLLLIMTFSV